jgi:hypothetical protein
MMKRYIGTKTLLAMPMTRGQYNNYQGWLTPEGQDKDTPGYLVEYTDGGLPNHPAHTGYISWSPAEQFEKTYREIPASTLQPHQQRVVDEKAELDTKMLALLKFVDTPIFTGLATDEQRRLRSQYSAMHMYSSVLAERIKAF